MKMRSILFLLILPACVLLCGGCSLPHIITPAEQTASALETGTSFAITLTALRPTDTPVPSDTPTPSPTPTSTPTAVPSPTPTEGPSPTPTLGPEYFHGSLWYEPGFVSQYGLSYYGSEITTGCTAACVQMVLDFWHAYKEEYQTMTAQELIDQNIFQKQFHVQTGLNILDTEDDLQMMDYYLGVRENSNKEELIAALERYGPLLILTRVNWTPAGAHHMAVLTGYKPEEDMVRLLDPWQIGGVLEMPYEKFDSIWKLNYLDSDTEMRQRAFFFIAPYAELRRENELFVPWYVFLYRR